MTNQKRILIITEEQYHLLINALNDLRTKCLKENISSIDVDELILQVIDSHVKGLSRESMHESR